MLSSVNVQELQDLITRDHPGWDASVIAQRAEEYRRTMDSRLDSLLRAYLDTGETRNFRSGEFYVIMIQRSFEGPGDRSAEDYPSIRRVSLWHPAPLLFPPATPS